MTSAVILPVILSPKPFGDSIAHGRGAITWPSLVLTCLLGLGLTSVAMPARGQNALPRPDHVVVVIEENRAFAQIVGNPFAPYINQLAQKGTLFTQSFALTHPSQPNYLALFSGSTQGVKDDTCPYRFTSANLATELAHAKLTFTTYSESLPQTGYSGCNWGPYWRKHNPAVNWLGTPAAGPTNRGFSDFPTDYTQLPTVALVIPNNLDDMHDGQPQRSTLRGDRWLRQHLARYVTWASTHNSLLILTWDEDDDAHDNHIATLFVGPMVMPGDDDRRIDHYDVLRTLTEMYRLPALGGLQTTHAIVGMWR